MTACRVKGGRVQNGHLCAEGQDDSEKAEAWSLELQWGV